MSYRLKIGKTVIFGVMLDCKTEQPTLIRTANEADKRLV